MTPLNRAFAIAYLCMFLTLLALGCGTVTPIPTPPPLYTCATMCQHGTELVCPWAAPGPDLATCEEVCTNAVTVVHWDLRCRSTAATCAAVDQCQ